MAVMHAHPECMHVRSATRGSKGQHPSRRVSLSEEFQEAGLAAYPEPWFALGKGERIRRLTMAVRPVSVVHDEVSEGLKISKYVRSTEPGTMKILHLFFLPSLLSSVLACQGAIINETQEIWIPKVDHIIVSMDIRSTWLDTPRNQNTPNFSSQKKQLKSRD